MSLQVFPKTFHHFSPLLILEGVTVGAVVIPQSLGYAKLAGLPVQYGLYTSFMGGVVYWLFATSKDITIGVSLEPHIRHIPLLIVSVSLLPLFLRLLAQSSLMCRAYTPVFLDRRLPWQLLYHVEVSSHSWDWHGWDSSLNSSLSHL